MASKLGGQADQLVGGVGLVAGALRQASCPAARSRSRPPSGHFHGSLRTRDTGGERRPRRSAAQVPSCRRDIRVQRDAEGGAHAGRRSGQGKR